MKFPNPYQGCVCSSRFTAAARQTSPRERVYHFQTHIPSYYVKLAQFASSFTAVLPRQYVERLRTLQDEAPHKDIRTVRSIIEEELKVPMEEIFDHFDPEPLGAASIGQVHRAVLRENGEEPKTRWNHDGVCVAV